MNAAAGGVSPDTKDTAHGPGQPGSLLSAEYMAAFTDPSEDSKSTRQIIYALMRHAPGKRGRLVNSLMPPPPARPTSWQNDEFKRDEDFSKMPKLWGTGGKPLQNEQLELGLPDQFLSLTDRHLNHLKEWAEGNFEVWHSTKARCA